MKGISRRERGDVKRKKKEGCFFPACPHKLPLRVIENSISAQ